MATTNKDQAWAAGGQPWRGIIPPLITPLRSRDELDAAGLERLLEYIIDGGAHGVFVLGSTGETASLSQRVRRELVEQTCRIVRGRVPVLVGITDTVFVDSVSMARHAAACGARMLVATAPYFFLIGQPELAHYYERLLAELPLPLFLYNIPQLTKTQLAPETVRRLMDFPQIVGIKDSSGDVEYLRRLLDLARARKDWSVLVGAEDLIPETVQNGGHGAIVGGANYHPRLYVEMYNAAVKGDAARGAALARELAGLTDIHRTGTFVSTSIKGIKYALSIMGICGETVAEPLTPLSAGEKERLRAALEKAGLSRAK